MIKKKNTNEKHPIKLSDNEQKVYIIEFIEKIIDTDLSRFTYIGIFGSEEKAREAVNALLKKDKFRKYTSENFIISPSVVDLIYWFDGFIQKY